MSGGAGEVLLSILVIILGAKLGGELAERLRQPAVLGELLVGILLGASLLGGFVGMPHFDLEGDAAQAAHDIQEGGSPSAALFLANHHGELSILAVLTTLAALGAVLLLFEVGLESDVKELRRVGAASLLVAFLGIAVSFAVGYGSSWLIARLWDPWQAASDVLPNYLLHIFVGAALTATSVGITARVLADMGRLKSTEARIILGAAVLDDIGGLIILAIVGAMVTAAQAGSAVDQLEILRISATAIGFLVISLIVGLALVPRVFDALCSKFRVKGFPVALAIVFALLMAYLASLAGLADIVGAFAGGLILAQSRNAHAIFEDLRPIAAIFVSFFFVTLGMRVDLTQMEGHGAMVVLIGVLLSIVAIAAKLSCGFGVVKARANKLIVGVGMAPRGEVGLIFAALGLTTGLLENWQYTAMIFVVLLTTFVTPLWLARLKDSFRPEPGGPPTAGHGVSQIMEA